MKVGGTQNKGYVTKDICDQNIRNIRQHKVRLTAKFVREMNALDEELIFWAEVRDTALPPPLREKDYAEWMEKEKSNDRI